MSKPTRNVLIAAIALIAALGLIGLRAFQPPVPLGKVKLLNAGMSPEDVRRILGSPSRVYPGHQYTVIGTNYTTAEQWAYQRFLTFGSVNVLFGTNGKVLFGHYEEY